MQHNTQNHISHESTSKTNSVVENLAIDVSNLFSSIQNQNTNQTSLETGNNSFDRSPLDASQVCFFRVDELTYDKDYPKRAAFENVLASIDSPNFNFVYILSGSKNKGIDLYIGIVKNTNNVKEDNSLDANNYGEILKNAFEGNFNGSKLSSVLNGKSSNDLLNNTILNGARLYVNQNNQINAGIILGIPTANNPQTSNEQDFQGIDRLINSMLGVDWRIVVICEPVQKEELISIQKQVYDIYDYLSPFSKYSYHQDFNGSSSLGATVGAGSSINRGFSYNKSTGESETSSGFYEGDSSGTNSSESSGENVGFGSNINKSINIQNTKGESKGISFEMANKHAQDIMEYIDDELLNRIKLGLGKGLFKTSVYYMAEQPAHAERLRTCLMSLFQGNESTFSPMIYKRLDKSPINTTAFLQAYRSQYIEHSDVFSARSDLLLSRPRTDKSSGLCTYLTASEISLIAGLPQTEVPGLSLNERVDFGLNIKGQYDKDDEIELGPIIQRGRELENIKFAISKKNLVTHTFIAGMTGAGKTTTCHKLLASSDIPFMVIEPVKREYRTLINHKAFKDKPVIVFTLGNETVSPFRLNPFELMDGELVSTHIAMVTASFTSAFEMEGSMPQLLEEAIIKCYQDKGLDIFGIYNDKEPNKFIDTFPILDDLLQNIDKVVIDKGFDKRLQNDYIGVLKSRISNLTKGTKGAMLNCPYSTDFNYLINHNIVLEMQDLANEDDKALIVGFLLTRLSGVIQKKHKNNNDFRHITLIEEAHQFLKRTTAGDSLAKKSAVDLFSNHLAEIRKYGEGLIIVDQNPTNLAPDVIKNTGTKIIHRIVAKEDKDSVGAAMYMDEKQRDYLSLLNNGNAIIFSENTNKPVQVKIIDITHTNEKEITDEVVKNSFTKKIEELGIAYNDYKIVSQYDILCSLYTDTVNKLRKSSNLDVEGLLLLVSRLNSEVNRVGEQAVLDTQEIWLKIIKRCDLLCGKPQTTSSEETENRIKILLDFFTKKIQERSLSQKELIDLIMPKLP